MQVRDEAVIEPCPLLGIVPCMRTITSAGLHSPQILRFVEGIDGAAVPMATNEVAAQLNDPWGALVLRKVAVFPGSLDEALAALDNLNQANHVVPVQSSFFVSETGLIPINGASSNLKREFRAVISRSNAGNSNVVLISVPAEDREGLIELMSWDLVKQASSFLSPPGEEGMALERRSKGCFPIRIDRKRMF
jgi:hypothetical protein